MKREKTTNKKIIFGRSLFIFIQFTEPFYFVWFK